MSSLSALPARPVLAALLVASCLGALAIAPDPASSAPRPAGGLVEGEAWITVEGVDSDRDGLDDVVHVWWVRPAGDRARPVVVEPSPYHSGIRNVDNHDVDVELYVPGRHTAGHRTRASAYDYLYRRHGYAYVQAESLGSGGSTGCPTVGSADETAGTVAVVDWLNGRAAAVDAAGQPVVADWSNGHVGMIGVSYNGTLANAAAATGVEGLDAIIPISAISNWYGYYRDDGAVIAPGGYQGEDADVLAKFVLTRRQPAVCRPILQELRADQDRVTGDLNEFWVARDYRPGAAQVGAAVLVQHGTADWNVKTSQFGTWYRSLRAAGVPHRLWLHPGGHGDRPSAYGDPRWRNLVVDWFDRWLRGRRSGVMGGDPVIWQVNSAHRRLPEWPHPSSERVILQPQPGGRAAAGLQLGPPVSDVRQLTDDASFDAVQLASAARSPHRLLYRTDRLSEPVTVSGAPAARLRVAFDRPAANVSVALVDIAPNGRTRLVSEGWTDPQNRFSPAVTTPVDPGTPYDLQVGLEPQQYRFEAGHRIGVVLLASDHDYTLRPTPGTLLTVDLAGTWLELPVTGGRDALAGALD